MKQCIPALFQMIVGSLIITMTYNCLHRNEFHATEMVERTKKISLLFLYRFVFLVCHPYSHHR